MPYTCDFVAHKNLLQSKCLILWTPALYDNLYGDFMGSSKGRVVLDNEFSTPQKHLT